MTNLPDTGLQHCLTLAGLADPSMLVHFTAKLHVLITPHPTAAVGVWLCNTSVLALHKFITSYICVYCALLTNQLVCKRL